MNRKRVLVIALKRSAGRVLAAAFLSFMLIGTQEVSAATLVVDDDGLASATDCNALTPTFMSISAAEAMAMPGDTIKVCPGVYTGVFIDVNNLTLLGAQAGVDARTRPFTPDPSTQSIINDACGPVQIAADNVTLDGFTVQGSTMSDPCFIAGIWSNPGFLGNDGGYKILNNIVQDNIFGIFLNSNCTNPTVVQFNLIQNNNNPGPGSGNAIESEFGLCNTDIDKNKFSGHINASVMVFTGGPNLDVTNNELVGGTPGARIVFGSVSTGTISGNVSMGSTAMNGTIRLFGGNSNIAIDSNTLFNGIRGIRVDNPFAIGINSGVTAHLNCIQGNSVAGMQVDSGGHSGTLNAENNWWGSASGPTHPSNPGGTGDAIIDPDGVVDFMPFLTGCPSLPPGEVTGGGQVNVTGGRGSFGFNAKRDNSTAVSGHLNYQNHVTGARLNCMVNAITELTATTAKFSGTCSSDSAASSFMAEVEDNGEPGKNVDKFRITYGTNIGEGGPGPIRSGNIQIHK